ncbi:hypothetical protein [Candidatus Vagococcus giribetii]|uniref:hypothetical protein n=1 Tax=Candidatus Vagococcus giribetii TaxID=2230876 RepID=UPI001F5D9188|nr:hypothetical protein [Vagococcus sp. DIV0080]
MSLSTSRLLLRPVQEEDLSDFLNFTLKRKFVSIYLTPLGLKKINIMPLTKRKNIKIQQAFPLFTRIKSLAKSY